MTNVNLMQSWRFEYCAVGIKLLIFETEMYINHPKLKVDTHELLRTTNHCPA